MRKFWSYAIGKEKVNEDGGRDIFFTSKIIGRSNFIFC